jgi:hypothetical protein
MRFGWSSESCHEKTNQFRHLARSESEIIKFELGAIAQLLLYTPMFNLIYTRLADPQFMVSVLVAIATIATIVTIAMPLIENDTLGQRMKAVATERERIRARGSASGS